MADELNSILLGTKLDDSSKSITELNKQITELSAKVKSLKINIEVDDKVIRSLNDKIDNLRQQFNLNVAFDTNDKSITKTISNIKKIGDEVENNNSKLLKEEKYFIGIYNTVSKLVESMSNLQVTKGLDLNNFKTDIKSIDDLISNMKTMDINSDIYAKSKVSLDDMIKNVQYKLTLDKNQLSELKKQEDIYTRIDKALAKLNDIKVRNDKYDVDEYSKIAEGYEKIRQAVQNGTMSYAKADTELKKLTATTDKFKVASVDASNTTNAFSDTFKRFLSYFSIAKAINLTTRAIKEMVSTVFELDGALVELKKVSDLTGTSLKNFTADAYKLGQEISKSGKEVIQASTEFAKAGYSDEDLLPLAKSALVLTSIGDGIKDVGESASTIIAVLKGFNKPISDVTNILDAVNSVSNNSAQSFEDITFALQRMSGVMSASNVTMEDSISMFVAINEVLRNAEMSSTALNTISMRIRGLSEDGEAIDGLAPKLQNIYKTIAGIDLTDSNGQVKSLTEVTSELSLVWNKLTENQKQYISQESAGVRQSKAFLTLMGNYNRVLEVNELAYNSAGSAMKEFGKWQDSLEGKMNNLKSAIEKFSTNALNSNFIKGVIDATTGLINFADACGGLIPVILSLGTVMASLKLLSLIKDIDNLTGVTLNLVSAIKSLGAIKFLSITGAIVAGIMGISYVLNSANKSAQEFKETIKTLNDEIKGVKGNQSSFNELAREFDNLSKNTRKTSEETEKYYDIQNKLHELMPSLNGYYNEQGNFIITQTQSMNELVNIYKEYVELKNKELRTTIDTTFASDLKDAIEAQTDLNYEIEFNRIDSLIKSGKAITDEEKKLYDMLSSGMFSWGYLADDYNNKLKDVQDNLTSVISSYSEWNNLTDTQKDSIRKYISESEDLNKLGEVYNNLKTSAKDTIEELIKLPEIQSNINEIAKQTSESVEDTGNTFVELSKRIEKFNKVSSEMNKLNDILQSLNKNGALTSSEISSLLEISEDFVSVLGNESALREKLNTTLDDYKDKHRQAYYEMIKDSTEYYNSLVNGDVDVYNELLTKLQGYIDDKGLGYKVDLKNYRTIEEAKLDITKDLIKKVAGVWADYFDSTGNLINSKLSDKKKEARNKRNDDEFKLVDDSGNEALATNDLNTIYGIYAELQPLLNGVSDEIDNIVLKTLDLKLDSDIGKKDDVSKLYNERIKALEQQIFLSEKLQSTLKEGTKEWQDEIDKQNKLIQQQKDLTHNEANRLRGLGYSETSDEVNGKIEYWWGLDDKSVQNTQKTLDGITLTYEEQNQLLEDRLKLLDIEQSKYNTTDSQYKDITQQKYDIILKQEELLQKQIADLYKKGFKNEAKELEKVYVDLYKARLDIAKEFQSIEVDTLSLQIDNVEKVNNALNTLQKAYINMRKRQLNETKKMYQEEMKYVDEVYNKKKEAIQKERDDRYATRDLSDKTKSVSDIQSQLDLIKNDETQMAKRLQLEEELAKAKRELEDFNYDQNYDKQMEALENAQKQAKEEYEYRIELLEEQLNDEQWMREQFNKAIQSKSKETYQLLMEDAKKYGETTNTEIAEAWNICTTSLTTFGNKQFEVNRELENMANTLRMIKNLMEEIGKMSIETYSDKINIDTKGSNIPKHHTGINAGVVGGSQYSTKSMEQLTKLLKGELVINNSQADNFMKNVLPNMGGGKDVIINQGDIIIDTVDKDSLSELKKFVKQSNDSLMKQFKETFSNKGVRKNFKNAY